MHIHHLTDNNFICISNLWCERIFKWCFLKRFYSSPQNRFYYWLLVGSHREDLSSILFVLTHSRFALHVCSLQKILCTLRWIKQTKLAWWWLQLSVSPRFLWVHSGCTHETAATTLIIYGEARRSNSHRLALTTVFLKWLLIFKTNHVVSPIGRFAWYVALHIKHFQSLWISSQSFFLEKSLHSQASFDFLFPGTEARASISGMIIGIIFRCCC